MGRSSHHHHQIISTFNPACCVRPPPMKRGTPTRSINDADDGYGAMDGFPYSPLHSMRPLRRHPFAADEPSSPRVGCMGQIIMGGKASLSSPPAVTWGGRKLLKLSRMLSGKSTASPRGSSRVGDDRSTPRVSVADMDPPLPVVRRGGTGGANPVSLWSRRRAGGQALENLQIQQQEDYQRWGGIRSLG